MALDLAKAIKSAAAVKGGLVGRVCTVVLVACVALGGIGIVTRSDYIVAGCVAAIVLIVVLTLWKVISFAEKNPEAAILEGAQYLRHQRIVHAAKNNREIVINPEEQTQAHTSLPPPKEGTVDTPDEVTQLPPPAGGANG